MGSIPLHEQLGFKKVCLNCKTEEAKRDGKMHGHTCFHCGRCYSDLTGKADPHITKTLIYREFQEAGVSFSEKDVENAYMNCISGKELSFGAALNIIVAGAKVNQGVGTQEDIDFIQSIQGMGSCQI